MFSANINTFGLMLKSHRLLPVFFATIFLLVTALLAFAPSANAQTSKVTEQIGSGTLDSDRVAGPRWNRLNFQPLTTGTHTISVAWPGVADIRFSLFENTNGNVRIATESGNGSVAQWTGTLDETESYHLGIWSASGVANYTVNLTADIIQAAELEISSQPVDVIVNEGETATFSVIATGSGTLSYQWSLNDVVIDGATASTLVLSDVSSDDTGSYRVQITDDSDAVGFTSATLTVIDRVPLLISEQPANVVVEVGESATFQVSASGSGVINYQWFVNNLEIAGATSEEFVLVAALADNGNAYTVLISDDNGSVTSTPAVLTVNEAPAEPLQTFVDVTSGTVDSERNAGPRWLLINFDALATATHTITVAWDSDADVRFIVRDQNDDNLSSTIRGTQPGVWQGPLVDGQSYSLALWSAGGIANYGVTIEAAVPLSIDSQPSNLIVTEGENATFVVEASGSGTLSYQWFADAVALDGETGSTLSLLGAVLSDDGTEITVDVTNGFESLSSQAAILSVNDIPALGLFSLEADESTWVLQGPAPTLDNLADEDTDAWGRVLLRIGDTLLVGGDFQGIKPTRSGAVTPRPYLASLNAVTGQPESTFQVPVEVDSVVRSLVLSPDGNKVYIGGDFGLLIVDASTGELDSSVSVADGNNPGRIFDIAVTDTQLYIGGDFTNVGSVFRANIARLSLDGEIDSTWSPNVTNGFSSGRSAPVQAIAVSPAQDTVYIGGNFDFVEGVPADLTPQNGTISMLSVSALDGTVQPERFAPFVRNNERAVFVHDIVVTEFYVMIAWGGPNFVSFHSTDGTRLRQFAGNGDVQALQVVGNHVFIGHHGEFFGFLPNPIPQQALVSLEPEIIDSYRLHSFRIDDGSFEPEQAWQVTGPFGVWGIAVAEDAIWIAGQISVAGSNDRRVDGLVRFPASD